LKDFWLTFKPILGRSYEMMERYCLISATSVPTESIFSIARYIQQKERCKLSSRMLRFLILAKQSQKFKKHNTKITFKN
jgi:hypothetical protein